MATATLSSAFVTTGGRTLHLSWGNLDNTDGSSPSYNGGLTVYVDAVSVGFSVNTNVGGAEWDIYITLDDFVLPGEVVTVDATAGAWTKSTDSSEALSGEAVTNNSNRQSNQMDTLSADFNEVPWRYLTSTRKIGLVAFDNVDGNVICDRVEFDINGGGYSAVGSMAWNADNSHSTIAPNGVWEYFVEVDPSGYSDEDKITVTARIYPNSGSTLYKEVSINLWANSGGTADSTKYYVNSSTGSDSNDGSSGSPFATIYKACQQIETDAVHGGQIELQNEGNHELKYVATNTPLRTDGMIRIYPASGLTAANVVIVAESGQSTLKPRANRLHFDGGMTFDWSDFDSFDISGGSGSGDQAGSVVWHDGNHFDNTGGSFNSIRWNNGTSHDGSMYGVHCTDCTMTNAVYGYSAIQRSLNCTAESQKADVQSNTQMTVNLWVKDALSLGVSGPHGDGYQSFDNDLRGVIVYGLFFREAIGYQGMYWTDIFDHIGSSVVNFAIDYSIDTGGGVQTQFRSVMENVLLMNMTIVDQQCTFRSDLDSFGEFKIVNCSLGWVVDEWGSASGTLTTNHFEKNAIIGTGTTTGRISVGFDESEPVLSYGGPAADFLETGTDYTKWRHPGVLNGSSTPRVGAFGLTGDTPLDSGGSIVRKPDTISLDTEHELYSSFRTMWAFSDSDETTWNGGTQEIDDLTSTGYNQEQISGQSEGEWIATAYGKAMRAPRLRASSTDSLTYPFQLVAVIGTGSTESGDNTVFFYGDGSYTTRNHQLITEGGTGTATAIQQRFGAETGAQQSMLNADNRLVVLVAQFNSASDRKIYAYVDGVEQGVTQDTSSVSSSGANRESLGLLDGSSAGNQAPYDYLFAGRTDSVWTDEQISNFGLKPFEILGANYSDAPTINAPSPQFLSQAKIISIL